jgi:hypothetical protein
MVSIGDHRPLHDLSELGRDVGANRSNRRWRRAHHGVDDGEHVAALERHAAGEQLARDHDKGPQIAARVHFPA